MDAAQQARVKARYNRQKQQAMRHSKASTYVGLTLGAMVIGIYAYSMYMVKQETIMQEIDDETATKEKS